MDEDLTGTQNLVLLGRLLGASRREASQRAAELLELFGLTDAADRAAQGYSGGMRRRLDLRRTVSATLAAADIGPALDTLRRVGLDPRQSGRTLTAAVESSRALAVVVRALDDGIEATSSACTSRRWMTSTSP